jgi:hypothetical protein
MKLLTTQEMMLICGANGPDRVKELEAKAYTQNSHIFYTPLQQVVLIPHESLHITQMAQAHSIK